MRSDVGSTAEHGRELARVLLGVVLGPTAQTTSADDLTGFSRLLRVPVQATLCIEDFKKAFSTCLKVKKDMITY